LVAAPAVAMRAFYHDSLGLRPAGGGTDWLAIDAGATRLTFRAAPPGAERPFYHFAFDIPENKILAAREWLLARTPLMPIPERLRDPAYPPDVAHFATWNAHALYFFDQAGNVVEFIARHDLAAAARAREARPMATARGAFGSRDILHASEIALVVDDVPGAAAEISRATGLAPYRGGDEQFVALGDEQGLLLVMRRGRGLNLVPESGEKAAGVFPTAVGLRGAVAKTLQVAGFPYTIRR
jgi:catechol-2,3-dioxygenase